MDVVVWDAGSGPARGHLAAPAGSGALIAYPTAADAPDTPSVRFRTGQIDCLSTSWCIGVDENYSPWVTSVFDGHRWSAPNANAGPSGRIRALSCQSSSFCMALDEFGHPKAWNRGAWRAAAASSVSGLTSLTCRSSAACIAAGPTGVMQYIGLGHWRTITRFDDIGTITAVSCPEVDYCTAVDDHGYSLTGKPADAKLD